MENLPCNKFFFFKHAIWSSPWRAGKLSMESSMKSPIFFKKTQRRGWPQWLHWKFSTQPKAIGSVFLPAERRRPLNHHVNIGA
jgi:hypothetical protein